MAGLRLPNNSKHHGGNRGGSTTKGTKRARVAKVGSESRVTGGTAHRDIARLCGVMIACNGDFEMHTQSSEMTGVRR